MIVKYALHIPLHRLACQFTCIVYSLSDAY